MTVFIIEVEGFYSPIRIAKATKEQAVEWFADNYPTRRVIDIYEL